MKKVHDTIYHTDTSKYPLYHSRGLAIDQTEKGAMDIMLKDQV